MVCPPGARVCPPQEDHYGEVPLPEAFKLGTIGRLYVGSVLAAEDEAFIAAAAVTHVLTAAGRLSVDLPSPALEHLSMNLADHPTASILSLLADGKVLAFCDAALGITIGAEDGQRPAVLFKQGGLLVHCASGISRSVSICIVILMLRAGLSYENALELVRRNRPQACPNIGFERQLMLLEECGGDIKAAAGRYDRNTAENIVQQAYTQRAQANILHERLDKLEDEFTSEWSVTSGCLMQPRTQHFAEQFKAVHREIDVRRSDTTDRVAQTILKAASQKVSRLCEQLITAAPAGEPPQ
eukprot:NODE_4264_length_1912_cov_6.547899.p1 GENE.NODE_4264_length_1912_cov_6.547899~~NODE_4264_length_1912_cov_6.547899.p1  ORF type:complete len:298 (+),score=90.64 NODE_4264_length_1912_cov_6.547899:84-977(+)